MTDEDFRTPAWLYRALDREFSFALDAACTLDNCLASHGLSLEDGHDALRIDWDAWLVGCGRDRGVVWCNPPFSAIPDWVAKVREEARRLIVVTLLPADTSTRWWSQVHHHATQVRLLEGRLTFGPKARGSHPSAFAIVIWSPAGGPSSYIRWSPRREDRRQCRLIEEQRR